MLSKNVAGGCIKWFFATLFLVSVNVVWLLYGSERLLLPSQSMKDVAGAGATQEALRGAVAKLTTSVAQATSSIVELNGTVLELRKALAAMSEQMGMDKMRLGSGVPLPQRSHIVAPPAPAAAPSKALATAAAAPAGALPEFTLERTHEDLILLTKACEHPAESRDGMFQVL
eukprot:TRINITY_DN27590_c0_g1_i1.p1 TRINITY_DN27590_c0_g1~~TRINITY_DN27590_c0_g1_i1.p1  ORF type:complete len:172 (+),score=38.65 TRINITY_DN27590_c0_g1_i1:38-553(+)